MKAFVVAVLSALVSSCAAEPIEPSTAAAVTATEPAPAAAVSDAAARADALLADMAKREAAYKEQEAELAARERGKPLPPSAPSTPTIAAPAAITASTPPVVAIAAPVGSVQFGGHDEAWWKNEMRTVEVRATDDTRRLQEAIDTQSRARDQMGAAVKAGAVVFAQAQEAFNRATAEVQRLQGEVRNDNAAVERIREDARRANVPPGWLRWP